MAATIPPTQSRVRLVFIVEGGVSEAERLVNHALQSLSSSLREAAGRCNVNPVAVETPGEGESWARRAAKSRLLAVVLPLPSGDSCSLEEAMLYVTWRRGGKPGPAAERNVEVIVEGHPVAVATIVSWLVRGAEEARRQGVKVMDLYVEAA